MSRVRAAAAGDVHASEEHRERLGRSFSELAGQVDLVLLAGDLTTHGLVEEAGARREEAVSGCARRLVLLHYAPVSETVVGEPEGIWAPVYNVARQVIDGDFRVVEL